MSTEHTGLTVETRIGRVSVRVGSDGEVEAICTRPATREEKISNPGMRVVDVRALVRFKPSGEEPEVATSSCGSD